MVASRTFAQIVRDANRRLWCANESLYYDVSPSKRVRLMRLRTRGGVLEGKCLHDGLWIFVTSGRMVWL